jgi:hypothetical protein
MDWNAAIEKNREALKRVLAMLVAMAGAAAFTSPLRGGRWSPDHRVGAGPRGVAADSHVRRRHCPREGNISSPNPCCFDPRQSLPHAAMSLLRSKSFAGRPCIR